MNKYLFLIPVDDDKLYYCIEGSDISSAISNFAIVYGDSYISKVESIIKI